MGQRDRPAGTCVCQARHRGRWRVQHTSASAAPGACLLPSRGRPGAVSACPSVPRRSRVLLRRNGPAQELPSHGERPPTRPELLPACVALVSRAPGCQFAGSAAATSRRAASSRAWYRRPQVMQSFLITCLVTCIWYAHPAPAIKNGGASHAPSDRCKHAFSACCALDYSPPAVAYSSAPRPAGGA